MSHRTRSSQNKTLSYEGQNMSPNIRNAHAYAGSIKVHNEAGDDICLKSATEDENRKTWSDSRSEYI